MTLGDAVRLGLDLEARCRAPGCRARTPLSAAFFRNRLGADVSLERLSNRLLCAGCGAEHPEVVACPPEEDVASCASSSAIPHGPADAANTDVADVPESHA